MSKMLDEDPITFDRAIQIARDYKEGTVGEGRRLAKEVIDLRRQVENYKTHDASWKAREDNLNDLIQCLRAEVKRHDMHATLPCEVDYSSPADMRRLASLYTHDLARPTSTSGEVALGACVERLCLRLAEMRDDRDAWRSIVTDLNRQASTAITNMGGVPR